MTDLVEFLRARFDDDERIARAAAPGPWTSSEPYPGAGAVDGAVENIANENSQGDIEPADAVHIARHDPARVLAEVAAKRAILASIEDGCAHPPRVGGWCGHCNGILLALVLPFRDHPDFNPAWTEETR